VKRLAIAATPIFSTVEPEPRHGSTLASLKPAPPTVIHLRGGEVVLYKRAGSPYASRVIAEWIRFYNHRRPHQALGMKTPAMAYALAA